jgi:hypothetical protein
MSGSSLRIHAVKPIEKMNRFWIPISLAILLAYAGSSCSKNANAAGNKSYLGVTNAVPGSPSMDVIFAGTKLNTSGPIAFPNSTGSPGKPYDTAIAGVHPVMFVSGDTTFLSGHVNLGLAQYYSLFLYGSYLPDSPLRAVILKDILGVPPADTLSSMRYLNFSQDTTLFELLFTNSVDTFSFPFTAWVGPNPNPSSLSMFNTNYTRYLNYYPGGSYGIIAIRDSVHYQSLDSVMILPGKSYTLYATGRYADSGIHKLTVHTLQHD